MKAKGGQSFPNYKEEKKKCVEFLSIFEDPSLENDKNKYIAQMQKVANRDSKVIEIYMEDLEEFFKGTDQDSQFVDQIKHNTKRYIQLFSEAVDEIMPKRTTPMGDEEIESAEEIIKRQRKINLENIEANQGVQGRKAPKIPSELIRNYEIRIVSGPNTKLKCTPIRKLNSENIGGIVSICGIVTRVTKAMPCLTCACYACEICGCEVYQTVPGKTFLPLIDCPTETCKTNQSKGKLYLQVRGSKFTSYQEIRIQEPSDQVPVGHIPRILSVIAKGEATHCCSPGDTILIAGVLCTAPFSEERRKGGLLQEIYIEAMEIRKQKKSFAEEIIDEEKIEAFKKGKAPQEVYNLLAKSIAPEIYGMDDVKKALLLMLIGGVSKEMNDGMKVRGNINTLLMGDPGVAKSQLLKYIAHISPRGVYTTGKGSSGVGLTAAIIKDPSTNEMTLEGGALVLADMGVCCIDEFDKMDESDRTNIHEVMEQQTVSIAKAGIATSLNARCAVLAAANPLYGRYNKSLTPHQNINLPCALLSRFDLIFLLLDTPNEQKDELLSRHVATVHQYSVVPKQDFEPVDIPMLRSFIASSRKHDPIIPQDVHTFIVDSYVEKRKQQGDMAKAGYMYITPRTLLGVIRLSQALAKLRFSNQVSIADVEEALRLMDVSIKSINEEEKKEAPRVDAISAVFRIVKETCEACKKKTAKVAEIEKKVILRGYNAKQLESCLEKYEKIDVLMLNEDKTEVTMI